MAAASLILWIGTVVYLIAKAYPERRLQHRREASHNEEAQRWEEACNNPKIIEHYRQVAQEEYDVPGEFQPPPETNTKYEPYSHDEWRLILPEAAMRELRHAFGENSAQAYHLKRAIELSIEHLMEEIADDAECARIIEKRAGGDGGKTPFDLKEYAKKREKRKAAIRQAAEEMAELYKTDPELKEWNTFVGDYHEPDDDETRNALHRAEKKV